MCLCVPAFSLQLFLDKRRKERRKEEIQKKIKISLSTGKRRVTKTLGPKFLGICLINKIISSNIRTGYLVLTLDSRTMGVATRKSLNILNALLTMKHICKNPLLLPIFFFCTVNDFFFFRGLSIVAILGKFWYQKIFRRHEISHLQVVYIYIYFFLKG